MPAAAAVTPTGSQLPYEASSVRQAAMRGYPAGGWPALAIHRSQIIWQASHSKQRHVAIGGDTPFLGVMVSVPVGAYWLDCALPVCR